jgi:DNA-binding transcriptional MocR family regulator
MSRTPEPLDKTSGPESLIDFDTLAADPSLTPDDVLRRCIKQVLLSNKTAALDYTDPAGWRPLRISVAERLQLHGMAVSPDEVLITNGAQQALDLILRLLVRPGDAVAVEAPTYGMFHPLTRLHGINPVEIPMTPGGMDLDALENRLVTDPPKLVYTMPNFHNPMGITTDQAHRERLIDICESARVPIVEDGFEEEMKYFGKAVLPLKSMDSGGIVFYVGSFSKVVFSGLRVGWTAAPRQAIEHLATIQQTSCLSVNTLIQAALERFCADGQFDAHLRRIHNIYRRRMQKLLRALNEFLPSGLAWTKPVGGYTLWLTLPESAGEEATLHDEFRAAGVALSPGQRYFVNRQKMPHFRISIACVDEAAIEEGCRRLGRVLSRKPLKGVKS